MKHPTLLLCALFAVTGCTYNGLSPNEGGTQTIGQYVLWAAERQPQATARPAVPMRLGVAQVGELTPPQWMLDDLTLKTDCFVAVRPVPCFFGEGCYSNANAEQARADAEHRMQRILTVAKNMGVDYLFIFGGNLDHSSESNPLAVLDWTIIGAYIIPGKNVKGTARAMGTLLNVQTGEVMLLTTASVAKETLSTWAGESGAERRMVESLRELAIRALSEDFLRKVRGQTGVAAAGL